MDTTSLCSRKWPFGDCQIHLDNKNPADLYGGTPLHSAAKNGHFEIVKYIAKHLKNVSPSDKNGFSPIFFAMDGNHHEIVTFLKEAFCKPTDV